MVAVANTAPQSLRDVSVDVTLFSSSVCKRKRTSAAEDKLEACVCVRVRARSKEHVRGEGGGVGR